MIISKVNSNLSLGNIATTSTSPGRKTMAAPAPVLKVQELESDADPTSRLRQRCPSWVNGAALSWLPSLRRSGAGKYQPEGLEDPTSSTFASKCKGNHLSPDLLHREVETERSGGTAHGDSKPANAAGVQFLEKESEKFLDNNKISDSTSGRFDSDGTGGKAPLAPAAPGGRLPLATIIGILPVFVAPLKPVLHLITKKILFQRN